MAQAYNQNVSKNDFQQSSINPKNIECTHMVSRLEVYSHGASYSAFGNDLT